MRREEEAVGMIPASGVSAVWCDDEGRLELQPLEMWILTRDGSVWGMVNLSEGGYLDRCENYHNFLGYYREGEPRSAEEVFGEIRDRYWVDSCTA